MLSLLHRWDYCWKREFDADVKIQSYYNHDGEQLLFYKKSAHQNTGQKEGCRCNIYIIARNQEFQFIWQKLYSREHQMLWRKRDCNWIGKLHVNPQWRSKWWGKWAIALKNLASVLHRRGNIENEKFCSELTKVLKTPSFLLRLMENQQA